jgi:hypothetical protein
MSMTKLQSLQDIKDTIATIQNASGPKRTIQYNPERIDHGSFYC